MRGLVPVLAAGAMTILVSWPVFSSQPAPTQGTANAVQALAFDVASHPKVEAVDIYKFLHQAIFGPGHAVNDAKQAAEALRTELAEMGPATTVEAWCDSLGGDPILVRVNLRAFVKNGFDEGALVESMITTANGVQGDPTQMDIALGLAVRWVRSEDTQDLAHALEDLSEKMKKQGYPAARHSEAYVRAYRPAYRVVAASTAAKHGWCGSTF